MKNFNNFKGQELSQEEALEIRGGNPIIAAIAAVVGSVNIGFKMGREAYHILND